MDPCVKYTIPDPFSPTGEFTIAAEPFGAADSAALRDELARELAGRYGGYEEIEGFGAYAGAELSRCFERRPGAAP